MIGLSILSLLNCKTLQLGIFIFWFLAWQVPRPPSAKACWPPHWSSGGMWWPWSYTKGLKQVWRKHFFYCRKYRLVLCMILVLQPDSCSSKLTIKYIVCFTAGPGLEVWVASNMNPNGSSVASWELFEHDQERARERLAGVNLMWSKGSSSDASDEHCPQLALASDTPSTGTTFQL